MRARRARPGTLLVALALLVGPTIAAPAVAHDQLLESDPAPGEVLDVSPEAITLTFSADILELSSQVVVTDAAGRVVLDSPGEIVGPTLIATVEQPFDAGHLLVTWRVVSSDGHPIDGTFAFVVLPAPETPGSPEPEATGAPTTPQPEPTAPPVATETPSPTPSPSATVDAPRLDVLPPVREFSAWPIVLSGVLLLLAGAWFTYRNRHR